MRTYFRNLDSELSANSKCIRQKKRIEINQEKMLLIDKIYVCLLTPEFSDGYFGIIYAA